jgi:hypothetical protein
VSLLVRAEPQSPEWVSDRVGDMVGLLTREYGGRELRLQHVREPELLEHSFWICTATYVENDAPLGYNRLTVQHPSGCGCELT